MVHFAWPKYLPLVLLGFVATMLLLILWFKHKSSCETNSDASLQTPIHLNPAGTEICLSEIEPPPPYLRAMHSDDSMMSTLPPARHSDSPLYLPENAYHGYTGTPVVEEFGRDLTLGVCWGVAL